MLQTISFLPPVELWAEGKKCQGLGQAGDLYSLMAP